MALSKADKEFLKENSKYIEYYLADMGGYLTTKSDVDDFEIWLEGNDTYIDSLEEDEIKKLQKEIKELAKKLKKPEYKKGKPKEYILGSIKSARERLNYLKSKTRGYEYI